MVLGTVTQLLGTVFAATSIKLVYHYEMTVLTV